MTKCSTSGDLPREDRHCRKEAATPKPPARKPRAALQRPGPATKRPTGLRHHSSQLGAGANVVAVAARATDQPIHQSGHARRLATSGRQARRCAAHQGLRGRGGSEGQTSSPSLDTVAKRAMPAQRARRAGVSVSGVGPWLARQGMRESSGPEHRRLYIYMDIYI